MVMLLQFCLLEANLFGELDQNIFMLPTFALHTALLWSDSS